jgi:hypothetical protein
MSWPPKNIKGSRALHCHWSELDSSAPIEGGWFMSGSFETVTAEYTPGWWGQLPKHHHSAAANPESVAPPPRAEFHAAIPLPKVTKRPLGLQPSNKLAESGPGWQKPEIFKQFRVGFIRSWVTPEDLFTKQAIIKCNMNLPLTNNALYSKHPMKVPYAPVIPISSADAFSWGKYQK